MIGRRSSSACCAYTPTGHLTRRRSSGCTRRCGPTGCSPTACSSSSACGLLSSSTSVGRAWRSGIPAVADGLTEALVCSLEKPHEAADLSAAEQAAIRYGELLATDHLAIDETVYDELRKHFTEEEIVELGSYCAFCVGFGRLGATWNMIEELPQRFHEGQIATPWGGEAITVR